MEDRSLNPLLCSPHVLMHLSLPLVCRVCSAGVKFFPQSAPYWDPLGLVEGQDAEFYWRLSNGEIKNGRGTCLPHSLDMHPTP